MVRPWLENGMADRIWKKVENSKLLARPQKHLQHRVNAPHSNASLSQVDHQQRAQLTRHEKQAVNHAKKSTNDHKHLKIT